MGFATDAILRLLAAVVLGGAIGLERETVGKPAGLRTNILIAVGSTLITLVSRQISDPVGDPGRIAAQIVTGVGFIGAGAIVQARGSVTGLTTAATIWAVAGIGIALGAGQTVLAVTATVLILSCLLVAGRVERWPVRMTQHVTFEICMRDASAVKEVLDRLSAAVVSVESSGVRKTNHGVEVTVSCDSSAKINRALTGELSARDDVISVVINT